MRSDRSSDVSSVCRFSLNTRQIRILLSLGLSTDLVPLHGAAGGEEHRGRETEVTDALQTVIHRGVVKPRDLSGEDDKYVAGRAVTLTNLEGHGAHGNVGHQKHKIRQAEADQEFVEHRKHYLEKQ